MNKGEIQRTVQKLVKRYGTNDPFQICKCLGINIMYMPLGDAIVGYRTTMLRIPTIVLNENNSDTMMYLGCNHELGHHCCGHKGNTDFLMRNNLRYQNIGVEFEANTFMVELILHNVDVNTFQTKQEIMQAYGLPLWAERYIDWEKIFSLV